MSVMVDLGLPSAAEDSRQVWSRSWVAAGVADLIPEVGDILPATIGDHGVHVTREPSGELVAGYNALQQGSCWNLPAQCGNGSKVACAYVSCGHARDGGVVRNRDGRSALVRQLLGTRPSRRVQLPMTVLGPVLLVGLDPQESVDEQMPGFREMLEGVPDGAGFVGHIRLELLCNWRDLADEAAAALGAVGRFADADTVGGARLTAPWGPVTMWHGAPNLVLVRSADELAVITAKPVNQARIEVAVACYSIGTASSTDGAARWQALLAGRRPGSSAPEIESAGAWA
ncbi:hypothetical protein RD149_16045 [Gordonia westfalica]|uniref:Uncharacterized protein n=1 Tax=Gordonia westfalica TaxID=158898 RepID=A0ABU2GVW4_9ACTN|nr:hypothetical protein [Gordonia westfalica]MDS1115272.1 hypothetical protein [Gordonia westfalica]